MEFFFLFDRVAHPKAVAGLACIPFALLGGVGGAAMSERVHREHPVQASEQHSGYTLSLEAPSTATAAAYAFLTHPVGRA